MELDVLVWGYLTIWKGFLKLFSLILIRYWCCGSFLCWIFLTL